MSTSHCEFFVCFVFVLLFSCFHNAKLPSETFLSSSSFAHTKIMEGCPPLPCTESRSFYIETPRAGTTQKQAVSLIAKTDEWADQFIRNQILVGLHQDHHPTALSLFRKVQKRGWAALQTLFLPTVWTCLFWSHFSRLKVARPAAASVWQAKWSGPQQTSMSRNSNPTVPNSPSLTKEQPAEDLRRKPVTGEVQPGQVCITTSGDRTSMGNGDSQGNSLWNKPMPGDGKAAAKGVQDAADLRHWW